ncbi:hypothetical protein ABZ502_34150 [Streptomyces abikoensis]|uniref:hypothetical protein n=1 Tax=Streptomyces abikoensis TaxID=97398 RepID=UPI0033D839CD
MVVNHIHIGEAVWTVAECDGNQLNESGRDFLVDWDGHTYKVLCDGVTPRRVTSSVLMALLQSTERARP